MGDDNKRLGRLGEDLAAAHLVRRGLKVLERNWRCRLGELDIVAMDGSCLVVCEVKTRSGTSHGSGAEAVTPVKVARLRKLGAAWLSERRLHVGQVRIDVVSVSLHRSGEATIDHITGVE
ncbi:MAG: YraN family protein [Candidatus Nanopelagicales bacterium]|nr:YraN family protein [Candidatus Nanopelagicales bacterium]